MKTENYNLALKSLLLLALIIINGIFIISYCHLFEMMNFLAKDRVNNYPSLALIITPAFFWVSAYLCRGYSPQSAGNYLQPAIEQLKEYPNNFQKIEIFLNLKLVMVKTVSSLTSALGGGALGKEGPSVHMTTSIFTVFGNHYKNLFTKIDLEDWIIAGSSTALAIVFNAPIAGIVFAAEKLIRIGHSNFRKRFSWSILTIILSSILFYKSEPIFLVRKLDFWSIIDLKLLIITALICGFVASFLKIITNYFYLKLSAVKSRYWHLFPIIIGLIVALISIYSGVYSFGGGIHTVQHTLTSNTALLSYKEVFGRIANTTLTFISGSAGGLIAPAITIGSGIGSIVGSFNLDIDIGIFLLVGMAGFLAVILSEPISAAIVVLEATGQNISALPFLVGSTIIASAIWKISDKLKLNDLVRFSETKKPSEEV